LIEEVFVDEFRCEICKKSFKKEGQMDNHLKSKKHIEAEKRFKEMYSLDDETELHAKVEETKHQKEKE
jgi:hypothetical protein